jgi:hypothetical protein
MACDECGSPTRGHNLGCPIGHREANAEIERLLTLADKREDAAYANGVKAALQRLWAVREKTADESAWADCEAMESARRGHQQSAPQEKR